MDEMTTARAMRNVLAADPRWDEAKAYAAAVYEARRKAAPAIIECDRQGQAGHRFGIETHATTSPCVPKQMTVSPAFVVVHPTNLPNYSHHVYPGVTVAFSYDTPIGFQIGRANAPWIVRENVYSVTTAKHMAMLDGGDTEAKARRISGEKFLELLMDILAPRTPKPVPPPLTPSPKHDPMLYSH